MMITLLYPSVCVKVKQMIQDIYPQSYDLTYALKPIRENDTVVLLKERKVALIEGKLPLYKDLKTGNDEDFIYLFSISHKAYFTSLKKHDELAYHPLRPSLSLLEKPDGFALSTAAHLHDWYSSHRYCGACGSPLLKDKQERALICPQCGQRFYPVIAPAVIIGLIDEDRILISRYAGRDYKGIALLAGFCEIGETAEDTCRREVWEEVGLQIRDISYFASQPWGIDNNLLLGYFAHLDGSDQIRLDRNELSSAQWIKRKDLPVNSDLSTLTATMIEAFRSGRII